MSCPCVGFLVSRLETKDSFAVNPFVRCFPAWGLTYQPFHVTTGSYTSIFPTPQTTHTPTPSFETFQYCLKQNKWILNDMPVSLSLLLGWPGSHDLRVGVYLSRRQSWYFYVAPPCTWVWNGHLSLCIQMLISIKNCSSNNVGNCNRCFL